MRYDKDFGGRLADQTVLVEHKGPVDTLVRRAKQRARRERGSEVGLIGHCRAAVCSLNLRFIGKDTFMLSEDVVRLLIRQGVVSMRPTARRDLQAVQAAFNRWHDESGRRLCELSRIAACATG